MNKIYIDFETRSECNLKTSGVALYAEHESTDVLCVGYSLGNSEPRLLRPSNETDCFLAVELNAYAFGHIFYAHNAYFDRMIWNNIMVKKYGYLEIPIERWRCTMAKALAAGLPASLDKCARALRLPMAKDYEGRQSMLRLSKPRKHGAFWTAEDKGKAADFEALYAYCKQDVEVMRMIDEKLPDLSVKEQKIWFIDQRINEEGVKVDTQIINAAIELSTDYDKKQQQRFIETTGGIPNNSRQRGKLLTWLKDSGLVLHDTQKSTIQHLLRLQNLSYAQRVVLEGCASTSKTSTAKYKKMLDRCGDTSIVREILQYHGAHTGRWAGRGIQIQNFPRPIVNPDIALESLQLNCMELCYDNIPVVLSSMLRRCIVAPTDCTFIGADFSQIEARVLAWLSGQNDVLAAFAEGRDLYCEEASKIYNFSVTKRNITERLVGKIAVLALGFGGGIGAFATMAKSYAVDLQSIYQPVWESANEHERANAIYFYQKYLERASEPISKNEALVSDIIKQRWRRGNQNTVNYWKRIEMVFKAAVQTGNSLREGVLVVRKQGNTLSVVLPSGRLLCYYDAHTEANSFKYRDEKLGIVGTYGGSLVENIVQAVARDIMAEAMYRLEDKFPVAFTVHDELVSAVKRQNLDVGEFSSIVLQKPKWAKGLPIAIETWQNERYGK